VALLPVGNGVYHSAKYVMTMSYFRWRCDKTTEVAMSGVISHRSTAHVFSAIDLIVVSVSHGGPSEGGSYPLGNPCHEFFGCALARLGPSHGPIRWPPPR
jgi:hypothetical protein